jgi:two-component system phosphate regulon response regulator PhoB
MIVVSILATTVPDDSDKDFVHGGVRFELHSLPTDGPLPLVDGALFAFIDWALPNLSGLELCRRLRAHPAAADAHLTMVLEEDDPEDRRRALKAGADDYMVGPPDRRQMLDRVLTLYDADFARAAHHTIVRGDLVIDLTAMQARWKGRAMRLAENEFRLLRFLAENPGTVHSRASLMAALGKHGAPLQERTADVWMKRLRSALAEVGIADALRTVRLHGYALDLPGLAAARQRRAIAKGGQITPAG